jgi:hypothetical protein
MGNRTPAWGSVARTFMVGMAGLTAAFAHHGSAISYDMDHPWTTKAVVVEFRYQNPHPTLIFERKNDKGETERWVTELITNPSFLLRAGWTKTRSDAALKPGTPITVTVCTSRVGGTNGATLKILNESGEQILRTLNDDNPLGQGQGRGAPGGGGGSGSGNPPTQQ